MMSVIIRFPTVEKLNLLFPLGKRKLGTSCYEIDPEREKPNGDN